MNATPASPAANAPDRLDEFLLHEYDHVADSLLQNEDAGERRVQFFLGVVTAVVGIIGLGLPGENTPFAQQLSELRVPIAIALAALLLFGFSTLLRIVERNVSTDRYKFALRTIRRAFVTESYASAHGAAFFKPYEPEPRRTAWSLKGGWLQVVVLMNAAIACLLVWLILRGAPDERPWVPWLLIALFIVAAAAQLLGADRRFATVWAKLSEVEGIAPAPKDSVGSGTGRTT